MSLVRTGSRAASLLGAAARRSETGVVRNMSSGHSVEQEIAECKKWKNITMVAVPACMALSVYFFSQPHDHFEEQPAYSYMHIRSKGFPWGECGLFESSCWKKDE
eukprot:scaffold222552_cov49-Prasinocladus_malaysianus.AAC.2